MIINDLLTENPGKNIPITHSLGTPTFINTSFNDSKDSKKSDSVTHTYWKLKDI